MTLVAAAVSLHLVRVAIVWLACTGIATRMLVERDQRLGLLLGTLGWIAMCITVAPTSLRDRPLLLGTGVVVAVAAAAGAGWLLRGRRALLAVLLAAALPLRVPVPLAGETFNILAPFYAVLAAALFAQLWAEPWRERARPRAGLALFADLGMVAMTIMLALSVEWSIDRAAGAVKVALFILPFALLYTLVRRWVDEGMSLRSPAIAFGTVMLGSAAIGLVQEATHHVWQNPKVMVANEYAPDFRTNSVFWDPNIYGRYLVAAIMLVLVVGVGMRSATAARASHRAVRIAAGAALLVALWYTYSQSSFVALAVACMMLVFIGSGRRGRMVLLAALLASMLFAPVAQRALAGRDEQSRSQLAESGVKLASVAPIAGLGIGGFELGVERIAENRGEPVPHLRSSHNTVITVAVEQGILGLAAYLLFVYAGVVVAIVYDPDPRRWWAGATFAALVAHSMFYAGFLEDPLTWACLAILAACVPAPVPVPAPLRDPEPAGDAPTVEKTTRDDPRPHPA